MGNVTTARAALRHCPPSGPGGGAQALRASAKVSALPIVLRLPARVSSCPAPGLSRKLQVGSIGEKERGWTFRKRILCAPVVQPLRCSAQERPGDPPSCSATAGQSTPIAGVTKFPSAAAGFDVIVPNQRGYGASSRPEAVEAYDITALTDDLEDLLSHYGHEKGSLWATTGALVVWAMAVLKPARVRAPSPI